MAWVTEPGVEVVYGMVDASGHRTETSVYMDSTETDPSAGGPLSVGTAIQGISANALVTIACRIRASQTTPGNPTDGPYPRGADKLALTWRGADGSAPVLEIGALQEAVLQSDKTNVNKAQALITALVTAFTANAVTAEGLAITGLTKGIRRRPPRRKKL